MTAGWFKPVLLVPANLVTGMPPDLLEALLAHELAHVRRHDYLVNLLQFAAEILLFFHPTVWWLSRRIRIERERIADDMAAALIGQPRRLALALNALSQDADAAPAPVAPAARDGDLLDRIRRLTRPDSLPARRAVAMPALAAMLAVAIAGAGVQAGPADDGRADAARRALAQLPGIDALIQSSGASHVLVLDARSGDTLVGVAENEAVPIASLTKLMTAMVLLDAAPDLSQPVRIDERDAEAARGGVAVAGGGGRPVGHHAEAGLDVVGQSRRARAGAQLSGRRGGLRAGPAAQGRRVGAGTRPLRGRHGDLAVQSRQRCRYRQDRERRHGLSADRAGHHVVGRVRGHGCRRDSVPQHQSAGRTAGLGHPPVQDRDVGRGRTLPGHAGAGRGRELTLVLLNGRALPA